jgi:4-hydroxy-tetrahydrodipicolinate reductase
MKDQLIRVAVTGSDGRMGQEVVKMVLKEPEFQLVAAISPTAIGQDAGIIVGLPACGILTEGDLADSLLRTKPDVLVDFTIPELGLKHAKVAIEHGVRPIMGTSGFTEDAIPILDKLCLERGIGGLIAPNFSMGALLMMKFAQEAAKFFPHVEIIEYHGDQKLDAPSGTAVKTAELISSVRDELRQGNPREHEMLEGARGGYYNGFRIHSVRLPGIFAQQEVVFGAYGQTLRIRHDSFDRAGYMPGVAKAIRAVMKYTGMVYGFEHLME